MSESSSFLLPVYSHLHIVLHNEIHSAAFDVTTCQSNLTEYGLARRRIFGHGRWECDCQSHQSLRRAFRCAKRYASDCNKIRHRFPLFHAWKLFLLSAQPCQWKLGVPALLDVIENLALFQTLRRDKNHNLRNENYKVRCVRFSMIHCNIQYAA